jgi:hypothetical protein
VMWSGNVLCDGAMREDAHPSVTIIGERSLVCQCSELERRDEQIMMLK